MQNKSDTKDTNPTVDQVLAQLVAMFQTQPNFKKHWEKFVKTWRDNDGSFTLWGLFNEFSRFIRDNWSEIPDPKRKELMDFIESCVKDDHENNNDLDNAVCTCFLENLAGEPPLSGQLRKHMGPKSVKFFNGWDYPRKI